jgi:hypothetical protein
MAMELHVLSDRLLRSITEWQSAIDAERFPLRLAENVDFLSARGFLPAQLADKQIGFECFHDNARDTMAFLGEDNFDHRWRFALGFRWLGSKFEELQAAWMAATAYAAATSGVLFDHEEGKVLTFEQARETVRAIARDASAMESILDEVKRRFSASSGN